MYKPGRSKNTRAHLMRAVPSDPANQKKPVNIRHEQQHKNQHRALTTDATFKNSSSKLSVQLFIQLEMKFQRGKI